MRSGSTGRLRSAICTERKSLSVERHPAPIALDHNQFAQLHPLEGRETESAAQADPPATDHRGVLGRPRILHLGVETRTARAAHSSSLIDRESADQTFYLLRHPLLGRCVLLASAMGERIQHFGD